MLTHECEPEKAPRSAQSAHPPASALSATLDAEMEYGVNFVEDSQLLFGDGTGTNLYGLVPQATAYSAPFVPTVRRRSTVWAPR